MADSPHAHYRIAGYLTVMSVFGSAVAAAGALSRVTGREPPAAYAVPDLVLGAVAAHKFARLVSKDGVTTPLRAPFTHFEENIGSAEVAESPREEPVRHVVGEMLTCPFCVTPWIATGYVAALTLAPRLARTWAAVFSIVGGSDFLQHAYAHVRTD
ncbi:DUF1360 domain-containing protein [Nocardioides sp. DS6]|uniref:DUF1360 domain-containing protein n=1 Tax=Nocardioides eburneus TaxID=3231482 RepID=A0ABV3SVG7_9ACTN